MSLPRSYHCHVQLPLRSSRSFSVTQLSTHSLPVLPTVLHAEGGLQHPVLHLPLTSIPDNYCLFLWMDMPKKNLQPILQHTSTSYKHTFMQSMLWKAFGGIEPPTITVYDLWWDTPDRIPNPRTGGKGWQVTSPELPPPPHHEDDGDSTISLRGGVLLSCLGPFHALQARRYTVKWDMPSHNRMHPPNCYSRPLRAVRHRPTRNTAQRSLPERAHQTTDRPATQPPSPPACEKPLTLAQ